MANRDYYSNSADEVDDDDSTHDSFISHIFLFIQNRYPAFVGYSCLVLFGTTAFCCFFSYILKRRCGIDFCIGENERNRRLARDRFLREVSEAVLAAQMQEELEEEERERLRIEKRKERREKLTTSLSKCTMLIGEKDLDYGNDDDMEEMDEEKGLKRDTVGNDDDDDDEEELMLSLPSVGLSPPHGRRVPAHCAICLGLYKTGDAVVWSTNPHCQHVFHADCILTWLSRGKYRCPCCRKEFIDSPQATDHENSDEDEEENGANNANSSDTNLNDTDADSFQSASTDEEEDTVNSISRAAAHDDENDNHDDHILTVPSRNTDDLTDVEQSSIPPVVNESVSSSSHVAELPPNNELEQVIGADSRDSPTHSIAFSGGDGDGDDDGDDDDDDSALVISTRNVDEVGDILMATDSTEDTFVNDDRSS